MAGPLIGITSPSPGINGLNLQNNASALGPLWCRVGTNCVVNEEGKLASRRGWSKQHSTAISGTPDVEQVFEYQPDNGSNVDIIAAGNKLYKNRTNPTDITGSLTITANNWKFQNFNGNVVGYQAGHDPIIWKGSGNFTLLSAEAGAAGLVQSNEVLTAWGRTWVVDPSDNSTIYYSDLLIPQTFPGATGGTLDLKSVWTKGKDTIVALAAFNSQLVIFGKDTITIYTNADDVTNIALAEVIYGTGCIARDSVQQVDEDIFYLARDGVRSLKRDILRQKMPMSSITQNVRDDIVKAISVEDLTTVRSAYHSQGSFYVITFPAASVLYCIDVRRYISEDHVSIFKWDHIEPLALHNNEDGSLITGHAGGYVGKYTGYIDNATTYSVKFKSSWILPVKELQNASLSGRTIILKKYRAQLSSVQNFSPRLSWSFDYSESELAARDILFNGAALSEWGTAEYGIDEYGGGLTLHNFSVNTSGNGSVFSFHFNTSVPSAEVIFWYAQLFFKIGRSA